MNRTMTHEKVVEDLRGLRKSLSRESTLEEIAALAGVTKQTMSQYCQMPGTRGARLIPGERLDALRNEHAFRWFMNWNRAPASICGVPREERLWLVCRQDGEPVLDTTIRSFAECYAARHGLVCVPGPRNTGEKDFMTADDWLCVDWLDVRHSGLVTKADAMTVTGTDEWTEGLIGYELPGLRIVPTRAQIAALQDLADERRLANAA